MLRRRHHPQEEAAGEAERGQEEDAEPGHGPGAHRGLHGGAEAGQRLIETRTTSFWGRAYRERSKGFPLRGSCQRQG